VVVNGGFASTAKTGSAFLSGYTLDSLGRRSSAQRRRTLAPSPLPPNSVTIDDGRFLSARRAACLALD
jgi:hypothetical protein